MEKPNINVTPLIDVLLVLLIIFMVVTPMKPSNFKVTIPQEPSPGPPAKPHPDTLIVTVSVESALGLNHDKALGSLDDPHRLIERLRSIIDARTANYGIGDNSNVQKMVFIKAPVGINYGSVVKVVDAVKSSGASPIALQIDDLN